MRKLKVITEPTSYWFKTKDGLQFDFISYDSKVDIDNMLYVSICDVDYKTCKYPTINELVKDGYITVQVPYKEAVVYPRNNYPIDVEQVISEFKEKGFNVSADAILHNYKAWTQDYKSGYRGDTYHLFTPCGCNKLSFTATTLHHTCKEWQNTYEA